MVALDLGPTDDRGQLILIGAIAIALIIVGVVLVVNTALFTEVVGSEGTVETAKESGVAAEELSGSVSALVHQENVEPGTDAPDTVDTDVDTDLEPRLVNSSLDSRGAFVSVDFTGVNESGTHVYQDTTDPIDDGAGGDVVIPDTGDTDVGYLRMVIDTGAANGQMDVVVNGTSSNEELHIDASASDRVTFDSTAEPGDCTVEATDGNVSVDVRSGVTYGEECHFELFDAVDGPYRIEFQGGDDVHGQYYVVVRESTTTVLPCIVSDCDTAVWSYDLQYSYDTGDVRSEGEREVAVYD